jgi:mRNA interferase MazF
VEIAIGSIVLCEFYFSDLKQSKKRPVLVLKDNLPYNDFVAVPISSKISNQHSDEVLIDDSNFFLGGIPKPSKVILRKTLTISKSSVIKSYGVLNDDSIKNLKELFCSYFECKKNKETY